MNHPEAAGAVPRPHPSKILLDRLGALLVLVVALPGLLLISLAVVLDSPGPVFVSVPRVGWSGRTFSLVRFRVTVDGSERPSRVGRVLRRWSLDEAPELLNVLRGDMSLVGPRPRSPERIGGGSALPVKPGLTGLWHLGRSRRLDPDRAAGVDEYVRNWSIGLDLEILWHSLRSAVRGHV